MLTLLFGDDIVRMRAELSVLQAGYPVTAIQRVEEKEIVYARFADYFRSVSMFDEKQVVVIHGKLDVKKAEIGLAMRAETLTDVIVVVEGDLTPSNVLLKQVKEIGGQVKEFAIEPEKEIFAFLDAVAQRQRVGAMNLLAKLWETEKEPLYMHSMLVWQFRAMMAPELQKGFTAQKAERFRRSYENDALYKVYRMLYQLEFRLKTGEGDAQALVEEFVLKVTQ